MLVIKKSLTLIILIVLTTSLFGCATTYHRGDGVVISEKKIKEKDFKPHQNAEKGAVAGAKVGAAGGVVAGALVGLGLSLPWAIITNNILITAAATVSGGVIGALAVGAAGGALGGGIGYARDASTPNAGMYEFVVKSDNELKPITITQYSAPIPLNTPVHILEKNQSVFIEQT